MFHNVVSLYDIVAISSPGMHTIYDFHSLKARPLKLERYLKSNPFYILRLDDSDESDEEDSNFVTAQQDFTHKMTIVEVGDDKIYIEDIFKANQSGWLPLHSCCMSSVTVAAGLKLIDEMSSDSKFTRNQILEFLNKKTELGPGEFNSGWTPLLM